MPLERLHVDSLPLEVPEGRVRPVPALEVEAARSCQEVFEADLARLGRRPRQSRRKLAEMLAKTGDLAGALENLRQALPVFETLSAASPTNAKLRDDLALTQFDIGEVHVKLALNVKGSV